ncbi:linear amide C-N hydrolase [Ancylobacter sp.]|uniref:linear amide C-N hydrolase n=1 Tax=Ancylobacter sp. TaxID=1872567 RepID=UPI003D0F560C
MTLAARLLAPVLAALVAAGPLIAGAFPALACTRLVYLGPEGNIVTARSMDWKDNIPTNLWILPRGIAREGKAGPNSIRWTARFGSLVATGFDIATVDGVNENGLAANVLWLTESEYPPADSGTPTLAISLWGQYVLDNFASVAEAVAALEKEPFTVVTADLPDGSRLATLHMAISDPTGDSAVLEYIGGRQVIYHGRQHQVMTNSPSYDQQLALASYWRDIGGLTFLPGTNRAADRFARAAFYVGAVPQETDPDIALASVFSVIRNVSVPYGLNTPDQPFVSSTRWRSVVDHKRRLYFFESALTPNTFWVRLDQIDFSAESGTVKKLDLGPNQTNIYSGNATGAFRDTPPFIFMGAR